MAQHPPIALSLVMVEMVQLSLAPNNSDFHFITLHSHNRMVLLILFHTHYKVWSHNYNHLLVSKCISFLYYVVGTLRLLNVIMRD